MYNARNELATFSSRWARHVSTTLILLVTFGVVIPSDQRNGLPFGVGVNAAIAANAPLANDIHFDDNAIQSAVDKVAEAALKDNASLKNPYSNEAPSFYPAPLEPSHNPSSGAKIILGKYLFNDPALSTNNSTSCATCHQPDRHFTDGRSTALGATGETHTLNTPTLYNVAFNASFGWRDLGITNLEQQHLIPLTNQNPIEMGYSEERLKEIAQQDNYQQLFRAAFPNQKISTETLIMAIAAYVRSIRAPISPFDRWVFYDDSQALSTQQKQGMDLFFSERLGCAHCHASINFGGSVKHRVQQASPVFHHTGSGPGDFRAPTLRQVAHTAPYMHNGSLSSLGEVIDHYQQVEVTRVPNFTLTDTEKNALIAFLHAL